MSALAPIVLFVYNRPEHTLRTLLALRNNELACRSDLVVYSDAPRSEPDAVRVNRVRQLLRDVQGFKSVRVVEAAHNKGLAASIVEGVTETVNTYGKVIVLEDDLLVSPVFLTFMNAALDYYRNDRRVMNVNGYVLPGIDCGEDNVFFTRIPSSWGWATWQRSWQAYDADAAGYMRRFDARRRHAFDFESSYPFFRTLVRNYRGGLKTWAVFWYATIFEMQGLCVAPRQSLVINIGNDGSGTHGKPTDLYSGDVVTSLDMAFTDDVRESQRVYRQYREFYRRCHQGFLSRVYMFFLPFCRKILQLCARADV